jgi:hypothetical protein
MYTLKYTHYARILQMGGGLIRIKKYPRRDTKLKSRKNPHIM